MVRLAGATPPAAHDHGDLSPGCRARRKYVNQGWDVNLAFWTDVQLTCPPREQPKVWRVLAAVVSIAPIYLIFSLDLSRAMKNLVLGMLCLLVAIACLCFARLRNTPSVSTIVVALVAPTTIWFVILVFNVLLEWDVSTVVLWAVLLILASGGQIVWARIEPLHEDTSV